jgi:hypothetical protein
LDDGGAILRAEAKAYATREQGLLETVIRIQSEEPISELVDDALLDTIVGGDDLHCARVVIQGDVPRTAGVAHPPQRRSHAECGNHDLDGGIALRVALVCNANDRIDVASRYCPSQTTI